MRCGPRIRRGRGIGDSQNSTAWTVIFEADPLFQLSCLNRFVYVKEVTNLTEALQAADRVRGQVSTVGLLAGEGRKRELVMELARWGVARVCPSGACRTRRSTGVTTAARRSRT